MTRLYLTRHGETEWNRRHRFCGSTDIPINELGRKQAAMLKERLKDERVQRVYASPLIRAVETAQIVFDTSGITRIPELSEIHFGAFEGLSVDEMKEQYKEIYHRWVRDPFSTVIPQGETVEQVRGRVAGAMERIVAENPGQSIAVVAHGGVISIYLNYLLRENDFWHRVPRQTALTIIDFNAKDLQVRLINDHSHLKDE